MSFFFSSRRRHTRFDCDWSSDVCSSDLDRHGAAPEPVGHRAPEERARAHRHPVDEGDHRDRAPAPVHRVLERLEEDAEGEQGALSDGDDGGGGGQDHPAVKESALTHGRTTIASSAMRYLVCPALLFVAATAIALL